MMMMGAILLIAQAAAAPSAAPPEPLPGPPDVELRTRIEAREVIIERDAPIRLELRAEPGRTDVGVTRSQPAGARSYRDLAIDARISAWLQAQDDAGSAPSTTGSTGEPK